MRGLYLMGIAAREDERKAAFASEIERIADALGRTFELAGLGERGHLRVIQVCPLCEAVLGNVPDRTWTLGQTRRELFAQYDQHRCVTATGAFEKFERAERALVTAMERIALIGDPELRTRAEHEADRMAAFAEELRNQI